MDCHLQILLVEKGTCFALWKDVIDNLSKYTDQGRNSMDIEDIARNLGTNLGATSVLGTRLSDIS